MKILLIGEYSNVHHTLAKGLRSLGHDVTVASDGDGWKDYPRDIDLARKSKGRIYSLVYWAKMKMQFRKFRGYDVVQLINPVFLPLKAERIYSFYHTLRKHNKRVFLGAYGMDHYWVKAGLDCTTFRYSDFNIGSTQRLDCGENPIFIRDWLHGEKGKLCRHIAADCDGIVSGLYEYHASYLPYFPEKLRFIPFPIDLSSISPSTPPHDGKVHFFIGVQKKRSEYKGTDIMLRALERVVAENPERCTMKKAVSVPFREYEDMMNHSHVLLDQIYSYTPAMNALHAMGKGLVVVSGGEPENYEILGETELRPIINVHPTEESVYQALTHLVNHPEELPKLSSQSHEYISRHHDHIKVAQRYIEVFA